MKSTLGAHGRWSAPDVLGLRSHFRRFARAVQHDFWPTPELAVLRQLEQRAGREPRRTRGLIGVAPYRFEYADAMSTWPQWDDIFVHESLAATIDIPEPRILDCGANIGLASIYFTRRYPRAKVTAFEADPQLAAVCQRNMTLNGLTEQVDVREAAVWTAEGTVDFVCEGADSGAVASLQQPVEGSIARVPSVRLRDWLDQPVDLLKVDIEGAEFPVLDDCRDRLQNIGAMIIDVHEFDPQRRQTGAIFDLLATAGFSFDLRSVTPLPWRCSAVHSPFADVSLVWASTVRAWRG
jgi:FkbM family methyltransferase